MIRVYVLFVCVWVEIGRFADEMVQDVTEIIGTGKVDLGFKAMIHTLAVSFCCAVHASEPGLLTRHLGQSP